MAVANNDTTFGSDQAAPPPSGALPCGKYRMRISKFEIGKQNGTDVVMHFFDILGTTKNKAWTKDKFYVTKEAGWKINQELAAVSQIDGVPIAVGMTQYLTEEFQRSLVGREVDADLGKIRYLSAKTGKISYINEVVNYISDKVPSQNLAANLEFTTDDTARKRTQKQTDTTFAAPVSNGSSSDDDDEVPF